MRKGCIIGFKGYTSREELMNQGSRKLVDTNILVYAEDDKNPEKQKLAINIISSSVNERNLLLAFRIYQNFPMY